MNENNQSSEIFKPQYFNEKGLNIHAIFNISELPIDILGGIDNLDVGTDNFSQLIVIGHLGEKLWTHVKQSQYILEDNPVDDFSVQAVRDYFNSYCPDHKYKILYPSEAVIGLQQLGVHAGWHHASPFSVGINEQWGTWFAYRVVVLTNTNFLSTKTFESDSPCIDCKDQPCIAACPANAFDVKELNFNLCIDYRKHKGSKCKNTCLSRISCPVGREYRYTEEQVNYHYGISMKTIEEFY